MPTKRVARLILTLSDDWLVDHLVWKGAPEFSRSQDPLPKSGAPPTACLFDDLVGAHQRGGWDRSAERRTIARFNPKVQAYYDSVVTVCGRRRAASTTGTTSTTTQCPTTGTLPA